MALSNLQISPIQLRNRSIRRHTDHHIQPFEDLNTKVNKYISSITPQIASWSDDQQILYFTNKISEDVHICFDILLPEFNQFTKILMMRWLLIGHHLSHLVQIWKQNDNIKTLTQHKTLKEWLPYIVKKKLPPNLIEFGSYTTLRNYLRIFENKQIVCQLPKLRNECTHSISTLNQWLKEFNEKVRMIAVQRDIPFPEDISQQIKLYEIFLAYHNENNTDNDNEPCKLLDTIIKQENNNCEEIIEINMEESDNSDGELEQEPPKLSKHEQQIKRYRKKIKKLKSDLSEARRLLKTTQNQHCQAARERHVYRELHREHEHIVNGLNEKIVKHYAQLNALKEFNIRLQAHLIEAKQVLKNVRKCIVRDKSVGDGISSCSPRVSVSSFGQQSQSENNIGIGNCCSMDSIYSNGRKRKYGSLLERKRRKLNDGIVNVNWRNNNSTESEFECGDSVLNRMRNCSRGNVTQLRNYMKNLRKENAELKERIGGEEKC